MGMLLRYHAEAQAAEPEAEKPAEKPKRKGKGDKSED